MHSGNHQSRQKRLWRACSAQLGAIIIFSASAVHSMSQVMDPETRVRERMSAYWEAMQKGDYETAAQYVHPDSRKVFIHEVPKSRVLNWKIQKLSFDKDYTVCDTVTLVTKPFPFMAKTAEWPLNNRWVLHDGEWYFKIPWQAGENPLFRLFSQRQPDSDDQLKKPPAKEAAERPAALDPAQKQPRLVADVRNPGSVRLGEKVSLRFHYTNHGSAPFTVVSVHSDCHCTSVRQDFKEVGPGETASFEVTLDTFGLPIGRLTKGIWVRFSDLPEPVGMLISVQNLPNFAVSPAAADFGTLQPGAEAEQTIRIKNLTGRTVNIISVHKSDPRLDYSMDRNSFAPGGELSLTVRYKPMVPGRFLDRLQFHLDLPSEPIISVPIKGQVAP